jgi:hypothetical protein
MTYKPIWIVRLGIIRGQSRNEPMNSRFDQVLAEVGFGAAVGEGRLNIFTLGSFSIHTLPVPELPSIFLLIIGVAGWMTALVFVGS